MDEDEDLKLIDKGIENRVKIWETNLRVRGYSEQRVDRMINKVKK